MIYDTKLPQFFPEIKKLNTISKQNLLNDSLLLEREGDLAMYYAPHNEWINKEAKIFIVGITPGWSQMEAAYKQLRQSMERDEPMEKMLEQAKMAASFSGTMRKNLTAMLDEIGLADALHIDTAATLFTTHRSYLHTTSVIKYPVFLKGKNYTGHTPSIDKSAMLKRYAHHFFPKELGMITRPTLVIPLGKATENVIRKVQIDTHTYLFGFPHPSGANGHREKQFQQNRRELHKAIQKWKQKSEPNK